MWGKAWNDTLIRGAAPDLGIVTDHPLIGGQVKASADPLDVYRDFMVVPEVLGEKWKALGRDLAAAGVQEPRIAVTELQMFAHLGGGASEGEPKRLNGENLVSPRTLAEALYDTLIYHEAVRLGPLVTMVTHSATVNHGGGLRKERERVYAQPCYYAQTMFAEFAGAKPVAVELKSPDEKAPGVVPEIAPHAKGRSYQTLDALAAMAGDGSLLVSVVHRGTTGPLRLEIAVDGFPDAAEAEVQTLKAEVPWAVNRSEAPEAIVPLKSTVAVREGRMAIDLAPFSIVQLRLAKVKR